MVNEAVPAIDFLGDARGPLVDAAGNFGVEGFALEGMPMQGLAIGSFLRVDVGLGFCGTHRVIVVRGRRKRKWLSEKETFVRKRVRQAAESLTRQILSFRNWRKVCLSERTLVATAGSSASALG